MLVEFSLGNFRSIKDIQTISFATSAIKGTPETEHNIFKVNDKLSLLKTIGIYGANGSGKSNLVKGFVTMLQYIQHSFQNENAGKIISPFLLDSEMLSQPTFFQIIFLIDDKKYRYGFEYLNGKVQSEWLFSTKNTNDVALFTREFGDIKLNSSFEDAKKIDVNALDNQVLEKNLLLNLYATFGGIISKSIKSFLDKITVSNGIDDFIAFRSATVHLFKNENYRNEIIAFLNNADFGFDDIIIEEEEVENSESNKLLSNDNQDEIRVRDIKMLIKIISQREVQTATKKDKPIRIQWDFLGNESEGTKKMFDIGGAILASLREGRTIFIDEFDARLHPNLTKKIVQLFNSKANKNNAQLFFVTHDVNLLDKNLLRRDQIYFAEKDSKGATNVYSLADFKGIRNDASFEKDYIKGKYGAIPFLGNFNNIINNE